MKRTLILALCTALLPVIAVAAPKKKAAPTVFQARIVPLLAERCAVCHLTGTEAGNMALVPKKAHAALVGAKAMEAPALLRVKPGDPDQSYLVMKLEGSHLDHGGSGAQMPFGASPLSKEEIALIRQWIRDGAKP